ncbi:MAG: hypothetical protein IPG96_18845 [Proteobacteria bacterium]|nr:hypothetical protein [Pseudomonadota bacterium]
MLRPSAWSFRNYESMGGSVLAAGAQIGTLLLSDPGGQAHEYRYTTGGVSAAVGARGAGGWIQTVINGLLKFSPMIAGHVAPRDLPSRGSLWLTSACPQGDLQPADLAGACVLGEIGGSLLGGASGSVMLVGLDLPRMAPYLALLPFLPFARVPLLFKGVILLGCLQVGLGVGASGLVGQIDHGKGCSCTPRH